MNAAARLAHHGILSRHLIIAYRWTKHQLTIGLLILSVLISAFSMIYITYAFRMLHAYYERVVVEQSSLHKEQSQLLLERSTLMRQAKVQRLAEHELNMTIPSPQSIVVVDN
jgi:cell division protein FtsL